MNPTPWYVRRSEQTEQTTCSHCHRTLGNRDLIWERLNAEGTVEQRCHNCHMALHPEETP
jgi:hypothetical protein